MLIAIASVSVTMLLMLLWWLAALCSRWRFQFSLRSLLALTVVVAIPFSWLAVEMKKAKEQKEAVEWVKRGGGMVWYSEAANRWVLDEVPPGPIWLSQGVFPITIYQN